MSYLDEKIEALEAKKQSVKNSQELTLEEKRSMIADLNTEIIVYRAKKIIAENKVEREKMLKRLQQKSSDIMAEIIAKQSKKWWQF